MHIIRTGDFVFGCLLSALAIYYLLGLFSNAPWLHTDGRRKDGRWVVTPTTRYTHFAIFLAWATLAFSNFDSAFYKDNDVRDIIILVAMMVSIVLLCWLSNLNKKKNRKAP